MLFPNRKIRDYTVQCMQAAGLKIEIDAVGNIFGRREGSKTTTGSVMCGSHVDSVKRGGMFDGALGVFAAVGIATARKGNKAPALSPAVRNLVAQHRLEASNIPGTGRDGSVAIGITGRRPRSRRRDDRSQPQTPCQESRHLLSCHRVSRAIPTDRSSTTA